MTEIETLMNRARVHRQWRPLLETALAQVDPGYLESLLTGDDWLPGSERLLAAFQRDFDGLRYLLIGESPYPRAESANGIAFYDAAVESLWSPQGLSKAVNRATSLRNIVKTALRAEGRIVADANGKISQPAIAAIDRSGMIETLGELFDNLQDAGFLLLNATPVLHPERKPAIEARYWRNFLDCLLAQIASRSKRRPGLVLWGKIAQLLEALPASAAFQRIACEHPYNISFIDNPEMLQMFAELRILARHGNSDRAEPYF